MGAWLTLSVYWFLNAHADHPEEIEPPQESTENPNLEEDTQTSSSGLPVVDEEKDERQTPVDEERVLSGPQPRPPANPDYQSVYPSLDLEMTTDLPQTYLNCYSKGQGFAPSAPTYRSSYAD